MTRSENDPPKSGAVRRRVAAGVGGLLGLQAMVVSTLVLTGAKQPGYAVLPWLVTYNGLAGVVSAVTAVALWRRHLRARSLVAAVALSHSIVLLALIGMRAAELVVATHSLRAMVVRSLVWWGIWAVARSAWREAA